MISFYLFCMLSVAAANFLKEGEKSDDELEKRFEIFKRKWKLKGKPLTYAVDGKMMSKYMNDTDTFEGLRLAFQMWTNEVELLNIEKLDDSKDFQDADLKILFGDEEHGDNFPFDGSAGVLAHAFYPRKGEIHFDDAEDFALFGGNNCINFLYVATHEIGHSLGLKHSKNTYSIMHPYYLVDGRVERWYQLYQDDIAAIREQYSSKVWCCSDVVKNSQCTKAFEATTAKENCCQITNGSYQNEANGVKHICSENFHSTCEKGYFRENACIDIDECTLIPSICGEKSCNNIPGSYSCD